MVHMLAAAAIAALLFAPVRATGDDFLVRPFLRDVTNDSATIVWETAGETAAVLSYGTAMSRVDKTVALPPARLQRVTLRDLKPGTTYYYRVEAGGSSTPPGDAGYFFRTAYPGTEPFEFAVYADTSSGRNGYDLDHGRVIRSILGHSRPAFVVVNGDMVTNGRSPEDWLRFLQVESDLIRSVPIYATLGNNDQHGRELFHKYFISPRATSWYSFNYGGCHFIVLDILRGQGERYYSSFRPGNPQITWLLADLQSPDSRNAKFTMVFFHAPVFSSDGAENRVLREMLHPLFKKYGVDIVYNGTHSYTRAELDGIQYVISGGGGAEIKPVKQGRRPEIKETAYLLHHLRVSVNYPTVKVEVVDTNGTVFSTFTYWDPAARGGAQPAGERTAVAEARDGAEGAGRLAVSVFSLPSCGYCRTLLERVIPQAAKETGAEVKVSYYPLDEPENLERLIQIEELLGDTDNELPAVVIGDRTILGGKKEIDAYLSTMIGRYAGQDGGGGAPSERAADTKTALVERFKTFRILPVLAAGLIDGINPCAFTTIIFLLSYLVYLGRKKREVLIAGAAFSLGVFIAYTALGLGLSQILKTLSLLRAAGTIVRYLTFSALLIFSGLSFYDYLLYRRGKVTEMRLQLPRFLKRQIHARVRIQTKKTTIALSSLGLGFVVSVLELACTGQIYLPTIVYMMRVASEAKKALALLLVYNLAFILPLVAVFVLAYFGLTAETLAKAFGQKVGALKLATALFFLALGGLVLLV